jgi:hypothetical protein
LNTPISKKLFNFIPNKPTLKMKKYLLLITGIILLINTTQGQNKAFHKGSIVIDLGAGISVYKTTTEDQYNNPTLNGTTLSSIRVKKYNTDGAGAAMYPLTVEYGVRGWLGIAGKVAYANYFGTKDSVSGIKAAIRTIDAGLILNLHIIKTRRFDMPIGVSLSYSNFKIDSKDSLSNLAKANGLNYGFAAIPRIYFGEHIGLSINLGYTVYTYPNLLFSNKNDSNINNNNDRVFKLKANGANIGVGLIVKF